MKDSDLSKLSETLTFDEGLNRTRQAFETAGMTNENEIITSRDENVKKAQSLLEVKVLPGFKKWQLPIYLESV